MQREIEAKFLNVDFDQLRPKLKKLGAVCEQPMRTMRRVVIDFKDRNMQKGGLSWIRLRDEGNKVTLTHKTTIEHQFGGTEEIEVVVDSYEKTIEIFKAMGLFVHASQETKRETWKLGEVEIALDEWPWLNPFIEIEASSKNLVQETANKLGFDWEDAVFGSVTTVYRIQYPKITKDEHISEIPEMKFDSKRPDWFTKENG